MIPPRFAA
jgi:Phasin protein